MLFEFGDQIFESEKERNLYYKFFAGYFFNELVAGYENRLQSFVDLLERSRLETGYVLKHHLILDPTTTHVSFDNHAYLLGENGDRGEFADIVLHDRGNEILIAVEAKFHSDWSYTKDIEANARRLSLIAENLSTTDVLACLLVTEAKWKEAVRMVKRPNSGFARLSNIRGRAFAVITWESLLPLCENDVARLYLAHQLRQTKAEWRYEFVDGKIVRKHVER